MLHHGKTGGHVRRSFLAAALLLPLFAPASHAAGTLRIGLAEDPDMLDPARGGSYVGRIVFAAMCDKLVDIDAKLGFVPQLATAWAWAPDNMSLTLTLRPGVRFQDNEPVDAEAVRINLERYRSAPESLRKGELKPVAGVDVIDPMTVRIRLSQPYAPLVAVLADRAGMLVSPKALARLGADVGTAPVCAGPFRFTSRIAQDRITLDRFDGYWNAGAISLDRIVYQPIPDSSVRLVNLQSGQLDMIERMAPSDAAAVRADKRLRLLSTAATAYQLLLFNLANGPAGDTPMGRDPRVRAAFEKSIDRGVLNQVVMDGTQVPSNQTEAPNTPYWNAALPVPPRDLAGAKALLAEAGVSRVPVQLLIANQPIAQQTGELIQSMAGEAGFDVKLMPLEANASIAAAQSGQFNAYVGIWSGRADPDGNVAIWIASDGFLNWGKYKSPAMDDLLARARGVTEFAARKKLYDQVSALYLTDRPFMVLYHQNWLFAHTTALSGFTPVPDGLIRPQGITLK
jgi:peptide/nickel transport system substrate-binding protein